MKNCPVNPHRISPLNDASVKDGKYVLYWIQQSQRAEFNHALEYAVFMANQLRLPLLAAFGLMPDYPDANLRHYRFMLEGLRDLEDDLHQRGIKFVLRLGQPADIASELAQSASMVVCDRGYLRHQKQWRQQLADDAACRVVQIESEVIVPVEIASQKQEYAARTIRPKLHAVYEPYLHQLPEVQLEKPSLDLGVEGLILSSDWRKIEDRLQFNKSVAPVDNLFSGGTAAARKVFTDFLKNRVQNYEAHRNQPQTNDVSHMAKYLHFGQISPVWLLLEAGKQTTADDENLASFTEELLVRRELAMNYVENTDNYDQYTALPEWAQTTLDEHRDDPREYQYSVEQLENSQTHDDYWNAAMMEMVNTGYMHNYMRMYWGKKILEWTDLPEEAFARTLHLNNKYFLDGRDPVSFASVSWLFGRHDRPWKERPIFGKIRYMSSKGLKRKCDIDSYVAKVQKTQPL
ncbi:MAG: deoxyribodipyrimidine photo-lyase [Lentisphaeria bacterium]